MLVRKISSEWLKILLHKLIWWCSPSVCIGMIHTQNGKSCSSLQWSYFDDVVCSGPLQKQGLSLCWTNYDDMVLLLSAWILMLDAVCYLLPYLRPPSCCCSCWLGRSWGRGWPCPRTARPQCIATTRSNWNWQWSCTPTPTCRCRKCSRTRENLSGSDSGRGW